MLAFFFLAYAGVKSLRYFTSGSRELNGVMEKHADHAGVKVPYDPAVLEKLNEIYRHFDRTVKTKPQLKPEFEAAMKALWHELGGKTTRKEWLDVMARLDGLWPAADRESPFKDTIEKAKVAARRWDKAQIEAL
jgi:hypothetical protein